MKRILLSVLLLVFVLVLGNTLLSSKVFGQAGGPGVLILLCAANFSTTPPTIQVQASDASLNLTPPTPGSSCAVALADILTKGFTIVDVQPGFSSTGAIYTVAK